VTPDATPDVLVPAALPETRVRDAEVCPECDRHPYDPTRYDSCYWCYVARQVDAIHCLLCGAPHDPTYATCFKCRHSRGAARLNAARELRRHVLARDHYTCVACGTRDPEMQVDHVRPCAKGGEAHPWNLLALCRLCNAEKGIEWAPGDYWDTVGFSLLSDYFLTLRAHLDVEGRTALAAAVATYRRRRPVLERLRVHRVVEHGEPIVDVHGPRCECWRCPPGSPDAAPPYQLAHQKRDDPMILSTPTTSRVLTGDELAVLSRALAAAVLRGDRKAYPTLDAALTAVRRRLRAQEGAVARLSAHLGVPVGDYVAAAQACHARLVAEHPDGRPVSVVYVRPHAGIALGLSGWCRVAWTPESPELTLLVGLVPSQLRRPARHTARA
jgi:hypothetical protein